MSIYTSAQISKYLEHIGFRHPDNVYQLAADNPLQLLTQLQLLHMARVPFESLSLHYSQSRLLSLDLEDLFDKIVNKGCGGYCMEVNAFFATVLRSLGFKLISVGGRVARPDGTYKGWDHMTNLVKINNQRYVVDVGFGSNGPTKPIPLEHGYNFTTIAPARGKLMYRSLIEHSDPDQRVWVYSVQEHADALWRDMYCFVEIEFFPGDFEVMNLKTMTTPQSFFVQNVMCIKTILNEEKTEPVGWVILHRDYLKRRVGDKSEIVETFKTEDDRIGALEKYFGIVLSEGAKRAIKGLASELRPKGEHA